jgi:hypothetical protein
MQLNKVNFNIATKTDKYYFLTQDPSESGISITNAAEDVVERITSRRDYKEQRIFYKDSEDTIDEILVKKDFISEEYLFDGYHFGCPLSETDLLNEARLLTAEELEYELPD